MRVTVLMEDTVGEAGLPAEHGFCLYIETAGHRVLMDTGASPLTWQNAKTLGVDFRQADTVVLSHGHYDHGGGLLSFVEEAPDADIYLHAAAGGAYVHGERYIGLDPRILTLPRLHFAGSETVIDGELSLFSGITGRRLWPSGNRVLSERVNGELVPDRFLHEQCLVIREGERLFLFSGCAHNGILNILCRFEEIYGTCPDAVVSGFHMMSAAPYTDGEITAIRETGVALAALPTVFYTGHCTGQAAFDLMKPLMGDRLRRLSCGDRFELLPSLAIGNKI